jgi:MoaA/NifB/PqqE/SkfB family radical SAM enzyme
MFHLLRLRPNPAQAQVVSCLHGLWGAIEKLEPVEAVLEAVEASKQGLFECLRDSAVSTTATKALTLKVLNLLLARHHLRARSTYVLSRPVGLVVDPSNVCNLSCPGCVHSQSVKELKLFDWGKGMLSDERLRALLSRYGPHAVHAGFYNYGEPLVNPHTPDYIRTAKTYLMTTVVSTSLSLERFDAEAYVESGLDFMVVSIDGATQQVYEKFRRKGNLELVLANLRKLVSARRRLGRRTPVIRWQYLAFEHNAGEIPLALEAARSVGVDQFTVATPFDVGWDEPGIRLAKVEPGTVIFNTDREDPMIANWNPFPDRLDATTIEREFDASFLERAGSDSETSRGGTSGSTCHWLYKVMTMEAGGRIFPCCAAPAPDRDLVFSNFDGGAGADPFNSPKHRLARLFFADAEEYRRERDARGLDREPYCVNCEWNKTTVNIDRVQIRQYLRAGGGDRFNAASLEMLCDW